jgi:hypothetical protein
VPAVLRALDAQPTGKVEAWAAALIHNCIAYVPGVSEAVIRLFPREPMEVEWRRGGRGQGDIVARISGQSDVLGHVEVKGAHTKVSWGTKCAANCGDFASQFTHMAHGGAPIVVIAPTSAVLLRERNWRDLENLPDTASVVSYARFAEIVSDQLELHGPPLVPLLAALYDVEDTVSDF